MARRKPQSKPLHPEQEAAIAHGLPGISPRVEAEVKRLSRQVRSYARFDIEEQRASVERLMVEGAGLRQIHRILKSMKDDQTNQLRWPLITERTVRLRMEQVRALRLKDAATNPKAARDEMRDHMIERLQNMRQKAMLEKPANYKAALACEREIAKLKGLYAPTKVDVSGDVNHSHALLAVMANMDEDLATEMLEEAKTEKRLAEQARALLPSLVVDVASEKE